MSGKLDVFNTIDASVEGIVELQTLLTAIPAIAPESGGDGELPKVEALEAWLRKKGVTDLVRSDSPDPRVSSGRRPNLIATIPGKRDDKRLWIMSHTDVVPPGDPAVWTGDPYVVRVKDGAIYGRGVEDNQQGLVSSVFAALALMERGIVPPHTVKLLFVADEEVGSAHGIQWLLKAEKLFRPDDLILIPDSGKEDGSEIEVAEKNLLWLKLETAGVQAHGSRPDEGRNAHLAGCELALALAAMDEVFSDRDPLFMPDRSTFCPTKKEANVPNINTIPAEDVFYMDMRVLPRYPIDRVLAEIDRRIAAVEAKHGVKVKREVAQRVESRPTAPDAPIVKMLQKAIKEVKGVDARPVGIGGGTVGAYLRNAGFDCVVWATLKETAHQGDERVLISDIVADAKIMAGLMLEGR